MLRRRRRWPLQRRPPYFVTLRGKIVTLRGKIVALRGKLLRYFVIQVSVMYMLPLNLV